MFDGGIMDYANKEKFRWISMIRQPDFVCAETFAWACAEVAQNKGLDTSLAQLFFYEEGLSMQCMHIGSYDGEPAMIAHMETLAQELGYALDMDGPRKHHEIYLNDPRKTPIDKRKTIIRHPLR